MFGQNQHDIHSSAISSPNNAAVLLLMVRQSDQRRKSGCGKRMPPVRLITSLVQICPDSSPTVITRGGAVQQRFLNQIRQFGIIGTGQE